MKTPHMELTVGPPAESLDEIKQAAFDMARELFRAHRALSPMFILRVTLPSPSTLIARPVGTDYHDQAGTVATIRRIAEVHQARGLYVLAENWVSRSPTRPGVLSSQPRFDPERREAVTVSIEEPMNRPPVEFWSAWIDRAHGRPKLAEWEQFPIEGGRLTYLLPREAYGVVGTA